MAPTPGEDSKAGLGASRRPESPAPKQLARSTYDSAKVVISSRTPSTLGLPYPAFNPEPHLVPEKARKPSAEQHPEELVPFFPAPRMRQPPRRHASHADSIRFSSSAAGGSFAARGPYGETTSLSSLPTSTPPTLSSHSLNLPCVAEVEYGQEKPCEEDPNFPSVYAAPMPLEPYDQTYYPTQYCMPYVYTGMAYAPYQPYFMVPMQYPPGSYIPPRRLMDVNQFQYTPAMEESHLRNEKQEIGNEVIRMYEESGSDIQVLAGHILTLACTQSGSRFLQAEVTKGDPHFVSFVLQEVRPARWIRS
jgi:hypothetical protein